MHWNVAGKCGILPIYVYTTKENSAVGALKKRNGTMKTEILAPEKYGEFDAFVRSHEHGC